MKDFICEKLRQVASGVILLCLSLSISFSQTCYTFPSVSGATGCAGQSYTLYATTFGGNVSNHIWYTSSSGSSTVSVSISNPGSGIVQSTLTSSFSASVTYWVSAVCSGGNSGRVPVSFTAVTPSTLSYSTSVDPLSVGPANNLTITASGGVWYEWRFNTTTSSPVASGNTYVPTKGGQYWLRGATTCGSVQNQLITVNYLPYADAGSDQSIGLPTTYTLYGSGSDPEGNPITFSWMRLAGSTGSVTLGPTNGSSLTLTNVTPGVHRFSLTVTDVWGRFVSDEVVITAANLVNNYDYVRQEAINIPNQTTYSQISTLTTADKATQFSYFDGLGRPIQTIQREGSPESPAKKDLVSVYEYDEVGRQARSYLPISNAQTSGYFIPSITGTGSYGGSIHWNFYNGTDNKVADDNKPYAQTLFESSPLGRVTQQGSMGASWQPGTGASKTISYASNVAGDVLLWDISGSLPTSSTTWPANLLSQYTVTDEQSSQSQSFRNIEGLNILSRTKVDATTWAETYSVYDLYNQLRFLLPPELIKILKSSGSFVNPTQTQIDAWAYQYKYDNLGRQIESKGPGSDWSYTIYDNRDRVVLSQDGKERLSNEWSYTKYDGLNRPGESGIYRPSTALSRQAMQDQVDAYYAANPTAFDIVLTSYAGINNYVASNSITLKPGFTFTAATSGSFSAIIRNQTTDNSTAAFPTDNTEKMVVTYYDSYANCSFCSTPEFSFNPETWTGISNEPFNAFYRVKDKAVASSVKVLGSNQWLNSVTYYNRQGQAIQTISSNHVNGIERHSTLPDFSGKTLRTLTTYTGMSVPVSTILRRFDYDHAGRLMKTYHQINSQPEVVLSANEYNELGQVVDKSIHSVAGSAYLQSVDYRYNIRGAALQMNSTAGDAGDPNPDYFRMELGYNNTFGSLNSARFDGAISGIKWKQDLSTKERGYGFNYNNHGWLTAANYKLNNIDNWLGQNGNYNEDGLSYDFNGNIKTLSRKQQTNAISAPVIDQLTYNYGTGGNKLFGVTDSAPAADKAKGFNDVNTVGDDYVYDINGNLIQDKNKNFTVTYNFLNLSDRITFSDNSYLQYTYDAGGTRLRQAYYNASNQLVSKTDYLGELMLLNDQLQMIHHEEGRIIPADYTNLITNPTREGGSLDGYTVSGSTAPTLSVETVLSQTYIKAVNNQAGGTPGVYPIGSTFTVKPGESYQFTVLGYQSIGTAASLYVWGNNGNIIWPGATLPNGPANEAIVTAGFTVPTGTTQIKLGVLWNSPAIGNTFYINRVALYKTDFEYQYFLTDQVGSPRVVLQTTPSTKTFAATMETENHSTENPVWNNLNITRYTVPPSVPLANATPGGNQSIMLDNTYRVGPAKSFKVFPGDQINGTVQAYYNTSGTFSQAASTALITALQTAIMGGAIVDGAIQTAYTTTGNPAIALGGFKGSAQPSAYLNFILFDENYVPLKAKSFPVQNTAGVRHTVAFDQTLQVDQLGYLFVYLSYDNENTIPVYFDELKITYTESPVIQVNNYYPFGLAAMEWVREGETDNNFLFQGKELEDKTGLHDFGARMYAADLGRWLATDPAGQFSSPYNSMGNNPVMSIDPDGRLVWFVPIIIGAVIGGASQGIAAENNGGHFFDGFWKGALVGAAAGATGVGVGAWASGLGSFGSALAGGASAGFVGGGFGSAMNGGNFLDGAWRGAVTGLVGAGLGGIGVGESFGANLALGVAEGAATGALGSALYGGDIGQGALYGGIAGGASATATSPQLRNAFRGQRFRSNTRVLADFVAAGNHQGALDYFGFKGTYDPSKTGGNPGATNTKTGAISYSDNAFGIYDDQGNFTASYHRLASVVDHEYFHQANVLSGKYSKMERPIPLDIVGQEEHGAYMHNYRRQGLYPNHGISLGTSIDFYGLQAGLYGPSFFQPKWWHSIYRIPRRY
jgi:RHS repeat-associated protein